MTTDELRNIVAHIVIGFARKDEAESGINSAKPFVLKAQWDSSSGEYSVADYDRTALHTAVNGGRVALLKFDNGNMADYTLVYVTSNSASDTFGGVSDGTLFSANLSSLNGAVVIDTYDVSDIVVIRSGAALGATAYQKPNGGIPKGDLSSTVQSSLSKADSALQSHQDLSSYATGAEYDSASKRIYLKHGSDRLTGAYVDATAFIKDGMVDNVTISSGYLVITFNTDSGKEPISLAITDIFNASNYYTKAEIDNAGYLTSETDPTVPSHVKSITQANIASWSSKQDAISDLADIRSGASKGATAYQKPSGGIPKGDLASAVQTSLGKADTALQSFTESDPTVPAWAKASSKPTYTAAEVGALPATTSIPTKTSDLTNDSGFVAGSKIYYGTCATAAATDPKVCTVEDFPLDGNGKPLVGTQICVKFSATDTSTTTTPHLNVNGTGAERIWVNTAVLASAKSAYHGYANRYITYMWDGTYWVWRSSGYDANTTYTNVALGHGYATQNNSAAATAITAALGSYTLTANGIVSVHFNYDVPANATLNVNGKGAKAIYHRGAAIAAGVIKAGDTATFVFSTYYHLISVDRDESADLTNYYTKTEIDTKIGNIETLLASI